MTKTVKFETTARLAADGFRNARGTAVPLPFEVSLDFLCEQLRKAAGRFWYIATPYSLLPDRTAAWRAACRYSAALIARGVLVFSPIVHSHPIAKLGRLDPLSHEIWLGRAAPLIDAAFGMLVIRMEGWRESKGIAAEIAVFKAAGKIVVYCDPWWAWLIQQVRRSRITQSETMEIALAPLGGMVVMFSI